MEPVTLSTASSQRSNGDQNSASDDEIMLNMELQMVCKICFEKQESWQMFTNSKCAHSFCYECTIQHATTKMEEKHKTIACPEINCTSTLDDNILRLIIPNEKLIKWYDFLCESVILDSQKLYCPYTNCSEILTNDDTGNGTTRTECPNCRRSFCVACRVPWHSEFSCKEFGKLKEKKEDKLAVALAKKKKWKKCPKCKIFVEKAVGCVHITCRCKCEFCYECGSMWNRDHRRCGQRTVWQWRWWCRVGSAILRVQNIF